MLPALIGMSTYLLLLVLGMIIGISILFVVDRMQALRHV
jgi:uncharacterized membrane protein SpoIIM required for sporulation